MDFDQLILDVTDCLTKDDNLSQCISMLKRVANEMPSNLVDYRQYLRLLDCLLDGVNTQWYRIVSKEQPELYDELFFKWDNKEEILLLLFRTVAESRPSLKLETCLGLLEKFILSFNIVNMMVEQCVVHVDSVKRDLRSDSWQYMISLTISLPDKIASMSSALPTHITEKFSPKIYFKLISGAVIKSLEQLHYQIQNSVDVNLEFLKILLGRCCLAGHTDDVMSPLIQLLILKTESDFIWRRLSQKLLTNVSDQYLETIITFVLRKCSSYKEVQRLLGTALVDDQRVNRLLTHKLLLVRCFPDVNFLNNLLGYMSEEKFQKHLLEVFFRIFDAWGNKTCVKHRQYHQHLYLTKALIISLKLTNASMKLDNKAAILQKMMNSMDAHLSSPMKPLHQIGMVTAQLICKMVDPHGPQLEFKCENDEIATELQSLLENQSEVKQTSLELKKEREKSNKEISRVKVEPQSEIVTSELDSDDDLEPYDLSHDTKKLKYSRPRYLRDCIEGLLVQDDPDRLQISLETVEDLVRQESVGLEEVAVELAKILLCMENTCAIDNYECLRFGALVSVTVKSPKPVATYLCEQFYMRNYNIRQRIDILEVLVAASQEISKPKQTERLVNIVKDRSQNPVEDKDWKAIVQKRLDSKTRYFHKTHVIKEIVGSRSAFDAVAGYFFFPLMSSYDNRDNTFDLLGGDFFLLGRLVWCLGAVLHAAKNCRIAAQMGQTLLEFITVIKYHSEPYVRRAAIFAICEVVANVPANYLLETLQDRMIESSEWLKEIIEHDTDSECQQLAVQTLMLLESTMKEALKSET